LSYIPETAQYTGPPRRPSIARLITPQCKIVLAPATFRFSAQARDCVMLSEAKHLV
jgi:hypothetical protein